MKKEKKDNTKAMKILCYFGIVICFLLIIIPPVLRKTIPRPKVDNTPKEAYSTLACNTSDNSETIYITYFGTDLIIGQIKYTFIADAESWIAKDLYQDLNQNEQVNRRLIEDRNSFDRMQFLLTPKNSSSNILSSSELQSLSADIKQAPLSQKEYYEKLGFTCKLTEENKN